MSQEVFTVIFSKNLYDQPECFLLELDVPKINVDLRKVNNATKVQIQTTIKSDPKFGKTSILSKLEVTAHELSSSCSYRYNSQDEKIKLANDVYSVNLDTHFLIDGVVVDQALIGPDSVLKKIELIKRATHRPKETEEWPDTFTGSRFTGDIVIGWERSGYSCLRGREKDY